MDAYDDAPLGQGIDAYDDALLLYMVFFVVPLVIDADRFFSHVASTSRVPRYVWTRRGTLDVEATCGINSYVHWTHESTVVVARSLSTRRSFSPAIRREHVVTFHESL